MFVDIVSRFRKVFSDLAPWQQPMIFLNNMTLDIVKLLVEFIYKGNISMPESQIENFLDAGRYLQIEGVAGGDHSALLEDQHEEPEEEEEEEEVDIPDNSIMNSTENYEVVEGLREANHDHLRSYLDLSRISGGLERSVRQDVSVNIRRMSKETTELYLSRCGEANTSELQDDVEMLDSPANTETNKRRSRSVSVVGEEEEEAEVIECEPVSVNTSRQTNKSRRSSRYEDHDEDFVGTSDRTKSRQSLNNSRRSDRLRKCQICQEKILSSEMTQHMRETHPERSSLTSTPQTSMNNSFINLGSLYRTRPMPMESRRSLMAKTTLDFSRVRKAVNKTSRSRTNNLTERREMIRTLETRPVPVREPQPSLPSSSDDNSRLPVLQPDHPVEIPDDPLGVSAPPPTQPEVSAEAESSEPTACSGESEVVTANIVNMNGRPMCRVCGMQVCWRSADEGTIYLYFYFLDLRHQTGGSFPEKTRRFVVKEGTGSLFEFHKIFCILFSYITSCEILIKRKQNKIFFIAKKDPEVCCPI